MIYQKLELHIGQVEKIVSNCRKVFQDAKKQEIYNNLIKLFEGVKDSRYKSFNQDQLNLTKQALNIVFYGLQHLNYKNEKNIPKKLIGCLNNVLDDWIKDGTKEYLILISHNNEIANFHLRAYPEEHVDLFDKAFNVFFGTGYKQSLIQISKPKTLFNDYLASTPVYHELGHFIDFNYQITQSLFRDIDFNKENPDAKIKHYREYFADLFASQYIGRSSIEPLNYIAYNPRDKDSDTHPANKKRIEVIEIFLKGSGNIEIMKIINSLKKITLERTSRELKIRSVNITDSPFETLNPVKISEPKKIHSLFSQGWINWLDENSKIRQTYIDPIECHEKINFLIMKSIVN